MFSSTCVVLKHLRITQFSIKSNYSLLRDVMDSTICFQAKCQQGGGCTYLMYVGYSSVFTKQTISNAIVIPILPMQAAITFSQCMSANKMHSTTLEASQQLSRT